MPVLDTGARGSTTTFAQRGIGDVLLSWENEAHLVLKEQGGDQFQIVYPPVSIRAEPPVSLVDRNVDKHNTREIATSYLKFLYSKEAQEIEARNFYRVRDPAVAAAHAADFPKLTLYDFGEVSRHTDEVIDKAWELTRLEVRDKYPKILASQQLAILPGWSVAESQA